MAGPQPSGMSSSFSTTAGSGSRRGHELWTGTPALPGGQIYLLVDIVSIYIGRFPRDHPKPPGSGADHSLHANRPDGPQVRFRPRMTHRKTAGSRGITAWRAIRVSPRPTLCPPGRRCWDSVDSVGLASRLSWLTSPDMLPGPLPNKATEQRWHGSQFARGARRSAWTPCRAVRPRRR